MADKRNKLNISRKTMPLYFSEYEISCYNKLVDHKSPPITTTNTSPSITDFLEFNHNSDSSGKYYNLIN